MIETQVATQSGHVVAQIVTPETSLSLSQLFLGADVFVQLIIAGLLLASFFSWAVIFNKSALLKKFRAKSKRFEREFWHADSFAAFQKKIKDHEKDPIVKLFMLGQEEMFRFTSVYSSPTSQELVLLESRLSRVLHTYVAGYVSKLSQNLGFLATLGSAAPYVGLLGTVWGIMHSFQSIAGAKNTSLAVVAPGIAEALFATALGLVAAIPAVIAYNKLSNAVNEYGLQLENFTEELISIIQQNTMQR